MKIIFFGFLFCVPAFAGTPTLDQEDIDLLTTQISKQIKKCKIWSGALAVSDFKNRTSESIDKAAMVASILSQTSKKSDDATVRTSGSISSFSSEKEGVATVNYVLKVQAKKGKKVLCDMKTQLSKTNE